MGCAGSSMSKTEGKNKSQDAMSNAEKSMKAALLIQRWYRRYLARLEVRRRCSWTIFQSLEYANEQDQLKLQQFFNDLLTHFSAAKHTLSPIITTSLQQSLRGQPKQLILAEQEDLELYEATKPESVRLEESYPGPHLKSPLSATDVTNVVEAFKQHKLLHPRYVLTVLHEARKVLRCKPNINLASTALSHQITVCGDLHGSLEDLLTIFYKNGLPARHNPYVFNGDFVDRGSHSIEILILLLMCLIVWPDSVYLNRGNHEDFAVNIRYGFVKEIMYKYMKHAAKIAQVTEDVYSWLPLCTVIDNKVFVVHGGISSDTDLKVITSLDRHQYVTILRASSLNDTPAGAKEWKQLVDLLWSDPRHQTGCRPNTMRGGGCFFGPDTTDAFLHKHKLERIIRSHECKIDGYEYAHNNKVMTIFSASNYYDIGSNRGAYVKLMGETLETHLVMYLSISNTKTTTITQRQSYLEECALKELKKRICASQTIIGPHFQKLDVDNSGKISISDWCSVMEKEVGLNLPWRLLCHKMAQCDLEQGTVDYNTTFDDFCFTNIPSEGPSIMETLYRNKENLETIFRVMDKDGSGLISMEEFTEACHLLSQYMGNPISSENIDNLARNMDLNKDGFIDFNEFLEAFRLVNRSRRQSSSKGSFKENSLRDGINEKLSPS
ncbi:serine/threonine-protein phosphatase with EF-hands pef-1-like [Centruroides vittatus]|uniref:serine/threonine-protein phosphatase with EF-hands pef-1-like n=1 Tax=Centruroides vittatus TaxID=120091 RepID=UPI00350F823E